MIYQIYSLCSLPVIQAQLSLPLEAYSGPESNMDGFLLTLPWTDRQGNYATKQALIAIIKCKVTHGALLSFACT